MKLRKTISLFIIASLLAGIVSLPMFSFAASSKAIDSFAQKLDSLNDYAKSEELSTEQMIDSRVIVRSGSPLTSFGDAKYIRGYRDLYVFQYSSESEAEKAVDYYNSLAYVKWAQIDTIHEAKDYLPSEDSVKIGLEYLSETETDLPRVDVAVVDTGINVRLSYTGEQDGGRLINSGYNVSNSGIFYSAEDDEGHGTKVCSVILRNSPKNVYITGYKALDNRGEGDDLAVAMCIDKAVADGNSIINLSLGGEGKTEPCLKEALQRAFDAGVSVIVAAGNENVDVSTCNPACEERAICVAAIDDYGNPESYSNYGEGVDFAAPGNIYGGGTSFSAPYITGVAASVKSLHPEYSSEQIEQSLEDSCYSFEQLNWHDSIHRIEGVDFEDLVAYDDDYHSFAQYINPCENERLYYGSGMPNFALAVGMEQCDEVKFSVAPGHYQVDGLKLTLSSEAGSTIYYSDDGSFPVAFSNNYTEESEKLGQPLSIPIEGIYDIRAVAYKEGKAPSIISFGEYFNEHLADELDFTIDENRGIITEYSGTLTSIIVPSSINGVQVNGIDVTFSTPNTKLNCLTLPETATSWWELYGSNEVFDVFDSLVYFKASGLLSIPEKCFSGSPLCICDAPNLKAIWESAFAKTNIRTANFPYASVASSAFNSCRYLERADFSLYNEKWDYTIQDWAFGGCYRLKSVKTNPEKNCIVGSGAFIHCYSLTDFDFSNVTAIRGAAFSSVRGIKSVIAPRLNRCENLPYSTELLYAPVLRNLEALPFAFNPTVVVPAYCKNNNSDWIYNFTYFPTFSHNMAEVTICAVEGADIFKLCSEFGFNSLNLPAIISEPDNMGETGGVLTADVIGINLSFQWYGTNARNNRYGTLLEGETSRELDTSGYDYRYYYCEATHFEAKQNSSESDIIRTIKTGYSGEDINCDEIVDIADVSLILANLTSSIDTGNDACDVDRNRIIDMSDLSALLLSDVYGKKQTLSSLDLPSWEYFYSS